MYQNRIVIFLDVLGFQNELFIFEQEAMEALERNNHAISKKANKFIRIVRDAISLINMNDYKLYLFTDNICITIDPQFNNSLWVDIFFTIGDLFKKFAEIGYFLRGGVDYGLMLDEDEVAVGTPLLNSYKLESETAFFPRVVVSDKYMSHLNELERNGDLDNEQVTRKYYFLNNICEIFYLNPFYNVIKDEDKIGFFKMYNRAIKKNLKVFSQKEAIFFKYKWLAEQFNIFLEQYIENFEVIEGYELDEADAKDLRKLNIRWN